MFNSIQKPYITIEGFGTWARLGNQMFQYAFLKTLSLDKGFDIKLPYLQSPHGYKEPQFFEAFPLTIEKLIDKKDIDIKIEEDTNEDIDFYLKTENTGKNILFDGYFQSEQYFKKYEDIIKKDFTFRDNIREKGDIYIKQIKNNINYPIVALHIRRADNLGYNSPTILVSDTFRDNAISYIKKKYKRFHILIFSDDKEWCVNNINYKSEFITQSIVDGFTDIEEMYIMSLCDHFIIGSSTFSWWSAWLSTNIDKIIIVPDKWFIYRGKDIKKKENNLIPSNWIKLSTIDKLIPDDIKLMDLSTIYDNKTEKLDIPDDIKFVKLDVGLSYNSPNSKLWLDTLPNRYVFGFEPNTQSCISVKKNMKEYKNFKLIPCAVDIEEKKQIFYPTTNDPGCSSLYERVDVEWRGEPYMVDCIKLSTFLQYFPWDKFPYIEHLKTDAQGNDFRIIKSIEDYIDKFIYITMEIGYERFQYNCNKEMSGHTLDMVNKYMETKGFKLISVEPDKTFVNTRYSQSFLDKHDYKICL